MVSMMMESQVCCNRLAMRSHDNGGEKNCCGSKVSYAIWADTVVWGTLSLYCEGKKENEVVA